MIDAEARHAIGHYGGIDNVVADGEAAESYQWAEEFIRAVKDYLAKD